MNFLLFLEKVILYTSLQILLIFGIFLLFGFLLYLIERITTAVIVKYVGWQGVLITGLFGVPVHEIGHLILAILFGHKIKSMSFYEHKKDSKLLGYINSSYNTKNAFAETGSFFIGIASLISGALVLYLVSFILPNQEEVIKIISRNEILFRVDIVSSFQQIYMTIKEVIFTVFSVSNFKTIRFWIFIYLFISISIHLGPYKDELILLMKGMKNLSILIFLTNIILIILDVNIVKYIDWMSEKAMFLMNIYLYACIAGIFTFLVLFVILSIYGKIFHKKSIYIK